MPKLTIIIPCYFNGGNIPVTSVKLIENEKNFPDDVTFEYVLVDDGSKDDTYVQLQKFQQQYPDRVKIVKLARNFGANNASFAGMHVATGDCNVILAADMQDPPELIPDLYKHWRNGYKLVLAYKANREDTVFTKLFSNTFHELIRRFALPNSPKGGFDLWLFDKQLRATVVEMNEKNFYLPHVFMWLGYEYVSIPYTRRKREIGRSGWTLSKKVKSFIDSFVSFSYFPLRLISFSGFLFAAFALLYAASVFYNSLFNNIPIEGWSSLMIVLLLVSAFMMISLGIIGEYLWRTLDASRNRPNFIVDKVIDQTDHGSKVS